MSVSKSESIKAQTLPSPNPSNLNSSFESVAGERGRDSIGGVLEERLRSREKRANLKEECYSCVCANLNPEFDSHREQIT